MHRRYENLLEPDTNQITFNLQSFVYEFKFSTSESEVEISQDGIYGYEVFSLHGKSETQRNTYDLPVPFVAVQCALNIQILNGV